MKDGIHDEQALSRSLTYAGFVLVMYELVKKLIVDPIKAFYCNTTFSGGGPFTDYKTDVQWRDPDEFEACLQYLRDLMEAISLSDYLVIKSFRKHRDDLADDLSSMLPEIDIRKYRPMIREARDVLFKLSNYRVRMEIGADPEAQAVIDEWDTVHGPEYELINTIIDRVEALKDLK